MKYPRVLVISHNSFSKTNNMGKTLSAFFSGWDSECLAQLYFLPETPDTETSLNYFRITDLEMVRSKSPGRIIKPLSSSENQRAVSEKKKKLGLHKLIKKYKLSPFVTMMRDLMWETGRWKNKKLFDWIDAFAPDVIFFAAGHYIFSMGIAVFMARVYQIPLVVYFGDDYYLNKTCKPSLFHYINKALYRKRFSKMFSEISCFFAASDKMKDEYGRIFNKNGHAMMTPCKISKNSAHKIENKVSYIGNLGVGRADSIVEVGRCLKELGLRLDVYSAEERRHILKHITAENGIRFHGAISSDRVKEVISESTLIIHVESKRKDMRERVKYSMSTKIAESLASGTCLFAYSPPDIASIEYLVEHDAACVVTKSEDLKAKLKAVLGDADLRAKYIANAVELAEKRHNHIENPKAFYNIISKTIERYGSIK